LREKRLTARQFQDEARLALAVARKCGAKILINDRVDIAIAVGADGVHLGQDDLPPDAARKLLGDQAIIGFSTHTLEDVARALPYPIDYLAIGPIFPTRTKDDTKPVVGLSGLARVRLASGPVPLVAIGGIDLGNSSSVLAAGADSVAVISALLAGPTEITFKTKALLSAIQA
jgi:thiamine-phosphate pyrophosphorylase